VHELPLDGDSCRLGVQVGAFKRSRVDAQPVSQGVFENYVHSAHRLSACCCSSVSVWAEL
jgi:hypothetical protein